MVSASVGAPCTTAGAKAPTFVTEGDQVLRMKLLIAYPQESILKPATLEVVLELLFDIRWQINFRRFKVLHERREVVVNDLVKKSPLRAGLPAGS